MDRLPIDSTVEQQRLIHGARFRTIPLNVKCRANCAFCYERRVSKLLPHVRTEYIPPYDDARFDTFRRWYDKACQWEAETGREASFNILPAFSCTPRGISHFPVCDVFSAGLSNEQIEALVKIRQGDICLLYSVGLDMDPDFVSYLTERYPETFRLHLSIVTFDPAIRRDLMHEAIDVDVLRRVCSSTHQATFFLMLFNQEQLIGDIDELYRTTSAVHGGLYIHKLYYDRRSPRRVVDYAQEAENHRNKSVVAIARMTRDERPLMFNLGADIQAQARRYEIYSSLVICRGSAEEVLFCSPGAFSVISQYFGDAGITVLPMESAFGGNIDFVQGCTVRNIIQQIKHLESLGKGLRRVLLPDSVFWIDEAYDLNGDDLETLVETFPNLDVKLLPVPKEVIYSAVELSDCLAFFG